MRIAYDHQIFGWQRFGGVSRYFTELAHHLTAIGDSTVLCKIICPFYVNGYLLKSNIPFSITGFPSPAFRYTGRLYRTANRIIAPFFLNRWQPDILHETYYSRTTVAPRGSRIILTVFDMIHEIYPHYFPAWDTTRDEKRKAIARADHIICISQQTRQDLIRILSVPEEKISVVYLGFDLTHSEPAVLPPPSKPFLLFVGSRAGYKNFEQLLECYASRPALRDVYDLVAFGSSGFSNRELNRIHSLGLRENQVRHLSGGDAILGALYRQATLFVYPSLYEGFGIPPLEAMSMDCPVVCSNSGSIPEVVGDAAIYFDPSNKESVADAIEEVIANRGLQQELRRRGRARLRFFSWEKCASETLQVYQKALQ